jgi:hypothetical protein
MGKGRRSKLKGMQHICGRREEVSRSFNERRNHVFRVEKGVRTHGGRNKEIKDMKEA